MDRRKIIIIVSIIVIVLIIVLLILHNLGIIFENKTKYVKVLEDGTKQNASGEFSKEKILDGLTIKDVLLTSKDETSTMTGTIINNTGEEKGGYLATIYIENRIGQTIEEVSVYIQTLEPSESTNFQIIVATDVANAYNYTISK